MIWLTNAQKISKKMQSKCCRTPMQINVDRISTVDCVYYSHLHKVQITLEMCDIKNITTKKFVRYYHTCIVDGEWNVNSINQFRLYTLGYFLCSKKNRLNRCARPHLTNTMCGYMKFVWILFFKKHFPIQLGHVMHLVVAQITIFKIYSSHFQFNI